MDKFPGHGCCGLARPVTIYHLFAVGEVGSLVTLGCDGGWWAVVFEISSAGSLVSTLN